MKTHIPMILIECDECCERGTEIVLGGFRRESNYFHLRGIMVSFIEGLVVHKNIESGG